METIISQFAHCIFRINTKEVHKHGLELNDLEKYLIAIHLTLCLQYDSWYPRKL